MTNIILLSIHMLLTSTNSFTAYYDAPGNTWTASAEYCKHVELTYIAPTNVVLALYWDNDVENARPMNTTNSNGWIGMNPVRCTPWMTNLVVTNTIVQAVPPEPNGFFRLKVRPSTNSFSFAENEYQNSAIDKLFSSYKGFRKVKL
jgi:hypothetical protein